MRSEGFQISEGPLYRATDHQLNLYCVISFELHEEVTFTESPWPEADHNRHVPCTVLPTMI